MQLSRRLLAIADMVPFCDVLADVGTDHGYLPIYLVKQNKIKRAIAMDVNKGPLERADIHIREYGLSSYIETRLSDGVTALTKQEADTVVIAGMGGPLTEKILTEGHSVIDTVQYMILQPQSDIPHVRRFLCEKGFLIKQENMVEEDGKYYPMMLVERGNMHYAREIEYRYGSLLLAQKHPVLYQYLLREKENLRELCENLKKVSTEGAKQRLKELKVEAGYNQEALEYYEV